jgi:hypothetical protein
MALNPIKQIPLNHLCLCRLYKGRCIHSLPSAFLRAADSNPLRVSLRHIFAPCGLMKGTVRNWNYASQFQCIEQTT